MGDNSVRRPLIAANWKMNGFRADGQALAMEIARLASSSDQALLPEILICPPATLLTTIGEVLLNTKVKLGGQDCHAKKSGAFTGDISPAMLNDVGCSYVITGHSERRLFHHETNVEVRDKAAAALGVALIPIICVGETEVQRLNGEALDVVAFQITHSLPDGATPETIVIAYEPVWAIGTGRIPTMDDIVTMHRHIRRILTPLITQGHDTRLLYGGSVNASNAKEILAIPDVDGALVGGASLRAVDFWTIVSAAPTR